MKRLVDILVENLPSWPAYIDQLWILDDGRPYASNIIYGKTGEHSVEFSGYWDIPCDYKTARVTRAEWQAAVDALNAPKVVEWDGVSLPPKGTAVEVRFACEKIGSEWPWHSGVVVASGPQPEGGVMVAVEANGFTVALRVTSDFIRPARTAEQVAAEEREKAIREICIDAGSPELTPGQMKVAEKLYLAGYRKQVAK